MISRRFRRKAISQLSPTQLLGEDLRVDGNILEPVQRKAERSFWEKDEP
jgi:hypothetical protein